MISTSKCCTDSILSLAWQLRYNAEDKEKEYKGVYKGQDNSQVGYGMEQVYQDGALSAEGGSLNNA